MQFLDVKQLVATMVSVRQRLLSKKKALSAGIELNHLGDPDAGLDDVMKESIHFIGACYGHKFDPSDTIGVIRPAIMREIPYFGLFPAFPHFCQNVPHFWLFFEITKITENRNNFSFSM